MSIARGPRTAMLALAMLPALARAEVPVPAQRPISPELPTHLSPTSSPTIEIHWAFIQRLLADPRISAERKAAVLRTFLRLFPGEHARRAEALALMARLEADHARATRESFATSTEWFAFQIGGGPYVGAIGFDFVTLRWAHVFWEIIHFRANAFISVGAIEAGTVVGVPLRLDSLGRHELRLGTALVFATVIRNNEGTYTGFGVTPQASYLYRRSMHLAVEATVSVLLPVAGAYSDIEAPPRKRPPPCPIGAVGLRF